MQAARQARRRRRRGLGRRAAPRACRRHPGRPRSCSPASARPRARWISRLPPASTASTSNPSRSSNCCRRAPSRPATVAPVSLRINPGCRRQDAQQDLDRQGREQVRHSLAARPRGLRAGPPSCPASRSPASTCISAARSPICSPSTTPSRCSPNWSAQLRADGHAHRACRSRRRARHSLPRRQRSAAAARRLCRRSSGSTSRALGLKVIFEPGRLIVGNAGILVTEVIYVKEGDAKNFVDRRRGDERPDPADALRRLPRDPPGRASQPADAPRMTADVVGPVCETGDYPRRSTATCRGSRPAT